MDEIELKKIGKVKNKFKEKKDPFEMRKHKSKIIISKEYIEGIYRLDEITHILVIFGFHKSQGFDLKQLNYYDEYKGVFATRSPRRPSQIATTVAKVTKIKDNVIEVLGLDAINDSPVLDIKPFVASIDESNQEEEKDEENFSPREKINKMLIENDLEKLLLKSAELHGHFCPGLALGVLGSAYAMKELEVTNDGMEEIIAITETNNCMADGIQFVTGCTFANNALVFRDFGKNAFTLSKRNGEGIRLCAKNNFMEKIKGKNKELSELFEKIVTKRDKSSKEEKEKLMQLMRKASFSLIKIKPEEIFNIEEKEITLPEYAPIHESIQCKECGENTMSTRAKDDLCLECSGKKYFELNGHGIY